MMAGIRFAFKLFQLHTVKEIRGSFDLYLR